MNPWRRPFFPTNSNLENHQLSPSLEALDTSRSQPAFFVLGYTRLPTLIHLVPAAGIRFISQGKLERHPAVYSVLCKLFIDERCNGCNAQETAALDSVNTCRDLYVSSSDCFYRRLDPTKGDAEHQPSHSYIYQHPAAKPSPNAWILILLLLTENILDRPLTWVLPILLLSLPSTLTVDSNHIYNFRSTAASHPVVTPNPTTLCNQSYLYQLQGPLSQSF